MPSRDYTFDELVSYASKLGLVDVVIAGYDGDGKFKFCSTHGDPEKIRKTTNAIDNYNVPSVSPERRNTVMVPDNNPER